MEGNGQAAAPIQAFSRTTNWSKCLFNSPGTSVVLRSLFNQDVLHLLPFFLWWFYLNAGLSRYQIIYITKTDEVFMPRDG